MSPKAVKQRLQTLDELWLLSVKLMNSKRVKTRETENRLADKKPTAQMPRKPTSERNL